MSRARLRCAMCWLAAVTAPAGAVDAVESACGSRPGMASPWSGREAAIQAQADLPAACLKALVRECSDAAEVAFLDGDAAAACSVRYEALLRHGFGGDFEALVAWWRRGR